MVTKPRRRPASVEYVEKLMEGITTASKGRFGVVSIGDISRVCRSDYDTVRNWLRIIAVIQGYPNLYVFAANRSFVVANIPEGSLRQRLQYKEANARTKLRSIVVDGEEVEIPRTA